MVNAFAWLEEWYAAQCDGEWEHTYGIQIETLDNPGWSVLIDLSGTSLTGHSMPRFFRNEGNEDWIVCEVKDKKFKGHGDPRKLGEILKLFQDWAIQNQDAEPGLLAQSFHKQK
jgi:hypothetical protein